jgi:hypothetical protein
VRRTLALATAAAVAVLAAFILGEYQLTLWTGTAAGLVVGFLVSELVLGIGRWRGIVPAAAVAALGGGALAWAGWIEAGHGVAPIRSTVWVAVGLAALVAGVRLRPTATGT